MSSALKTAVRNALRKSAFSGNTTESAFFAPAVATAICRMCNLFTRRFSSPKIP